MNNRIGPYHYHDNMLAKKTFGERSFTVLVASAYNAGIIGPECNGLVVLDDNHRAVLLDEHLKESTGYFGASARQQDEFKRVMAMEWPEFADFVRSNKRYRGGVPDIDNAAAKPVVGYDEKINAWIAAGRVTEPKGPDIRPAKMIEAHESSSVPYSYPDKTREEMIVALASHDSYHPMNYNNGGFVLSWDIKVRGTTDGAGVDGFEHDPQFDQRWEEHLEENSELFWSMCADALRTYTEDGFTPYVFEDSKATFYTNGRSGGHLVLQKWDGSGRKGWASCQMAFDGRDDFIDWLKDLPDADLAKFYDLVKTLDHDLRDPTRAVNYYFASYRESMEEQWKEEAEEVAASEVVP
jgi:hypothetical protein